MSVAKVEQLYKANDLDGIKQLLVANISENIPLGESKPVI